MPQKEVLILSNHVLRMYFHVVRTGSTLDFLFQSFRMGARVFFVVPEEKVPVMMQNRCKRNFAQARTRALFSDKRARPHTRTPDHGAAKEVVVL